MSSSQLYRLKIKNYRSFYGEQTISFCSKDNPRAVTAFYGPNASGKSNIAHALNFLRFFIVNSTNANMTALPHDPFLLKNGSADDPSGFEIEFGQDERHFVYGFTFDKQKVHHEYLLEYASAIKKPRTIFDRSKGRLNLSADKFGFGKKLFESTRPESLLITKARENNNPYANSMFEWLSNFNVLRGEADETWQWSLDQLRQDPGLIEPVLALLKQGDFWIRSFNLAKANIPTEVIDQLPFEDGFKERLLASQLADVKTSHAVRDKNQKIVGEQSFDLKAQESSGTQRFFELAAPLINTLANGKILYIDEFGSHLHPDMCRLIVMLFKSSENKNHAQLIINTHDTSLMNDLLERDDIIFVEKNYAEETITMPLTAKSARADESFEKRYRQGLYGARPQVEFE